MTETARVVLELRRWSINYLWNISDSDQAIDLGTAVVADHERLLGTDCRETMGARGGLALALGMQRRHDEAIALHEQIIAWYTANLDPSHKSTLNFCHTLGNNFIESAEDYHEPARIQRAIDLHERTLARYQQFCGPDHRLTLRSSSNLARAYLAAGRTTEAVILTERTVRRAERHPPSSDLTTMHSQASLAKAYAADGRLWDALALYDRCLGETITVLGADNPITLSFREDRALVLGDNGTLQECIAELEQVATLQKRVLGGNNHSTSRTLGHRHPATDRCSADRPHRHGLCSGVQPRRQDTRHRRRQWHRTAMERGFSC